MPTHFDADRVLCIVCGAVQMTRQSIWSRPSAAARCGRPRASQALRSHTHSKHYAGPPCSSSEPPPHNWLNGINDVLMLPNSAEIKHYSVCIGHRSVTIASTRTACSPATAPPSLLPTSCTALRAHQVGLMEGHTDRVYCIALSPDTTVAASGSRKSCVYACVSACVCVCVHARMRVSCSHCTL